jgi:hypothetical protein
MNCQQSLEESQLLDAVVDKANLAVKQYYRLVLIPCPADVGRIVNWEQMAAQLSAVYINLNLELSKRLLELSQLQRLRQFSRLLDEVIGGTDNQALFFNHLEILFEPSLQQDPLRCLQGLSRSRTVIAVWNGKIEDQFLIYAEPGHPEYRRYSVGDLLIVTPGA